MYLQRFLFFLIFLIPTVLFSQGKNLSFLKAKFYAHQGIVLDLKKRKGVENKEIKLVQQKQAETTTSKKVGRFTFKSPIHSNSKINIINSNKKSKYIVCTSKGFFYKPRNSEDYIVNPLLTKAIDLSKFAPNVRSLIKDTFLLYASLPSHNFLSIKRPPVRKIIVEESLEDMSENSKLVKVIKVAYKTGEYHLNSDHKLYITNALKEAVKLYRNFTEILVESYTDETGSQFTNLSLAEDRSSTVYNYLLKKGIPKEIISVSPASIILDSNKVRSKKVSFIYLYSE